MRQALRSILITGALVCVPVVASLPAVAQTQQSVPQLPFRILDADRLLQGTRLGQEILARNAEAERQLSAENEVLADQLIAEERELTDLRQTLPPEEFRLRAEAFDARVTEIRAERSQRSADLARQAEASVQAFFDAALPVLDQMMTEEGIVGLMRPEIMVLWSENLDITDQAIARLDAAYRASAPDPDPAPDTPTQQP